MPETPTSNPEQYDLIVLGGGPGGYVAAERAAAAGLSTLLVEQDRLGGVCLNRGCIPTKTLLHSAKLLKQAGEGDRYGVIQSPARYDLTKAMSWKQEVVEKLCDGVAALMKRHKVTVVKGIGRLTARNTVAVGDATYVGRNIIIATGSSPVRIPLGEGSDGFVLTSDEVLSLDHLPKSLVVIGGGVIGMEFAAYFRMVGTKVTVVEMMPRIIPNLDSDITEILVKAMPEVSFHLQARVQSASDGRVVVATEGGTITLEADTVLLSVGRSPNVQGIGLETVGVEFDRQGVRVDEVMRTNVPGVYAVGDVNGRSLLAHSAYRMAEVAVGHILGKPGRMRYDAIPWVVYSNPELAGVGLTQEQAAKEGREVLIGKLPLRANGRFLAEHGPEAGVCKVIVDPASQTLLGVQMAGGSASEMIFGAAAMIEGEFRVQDIREIVFPHPTVSEVLRDVLFNRPF